MINEALMIDDLPFQTQQSRTHLLLPSWWSPQFFLSSGIRFEVLPPLRVFKSMQKSWSFTSFSNLETARNHGLDAYTQWLAILWLASYSSDCAPSWWLSELPFTLISLVQGTELPMQTLNFRYSAGLSLVQLTCNRSGRHFQFIAERYKNPSHPWQLQSRRTTSASNYHHVSSIQYLRH